MTSASLKSIDLHSKFFFKVYFLLLLLALLSSNDLSAQIDIKSKIDAQTYSNYSTSIDLFEPLVNANDTITLFLPINFAFSRLSLDKQNSILVNKNLSALNQLLNVHSAAGTYDPSYLLSHLSSNNQLNKIELKATNYIFYQKSGDNVLLGDSPSEIDVKFESRIIKSIQLNDRLVLNFMNGIFLF